MSGSLIVSSALRRAVLSCNVARSACAPAVANFKNVNQIKISSNILSRNFMSSGISSNEEERDYVAFVPKKVFKMTPVADKSIYSRSSIFIGNLDFTVTEQGIMERLEEVLGPDIALRARIAVDRDTGMLVLMSETPADVGMVVHAVYLTLLTTVELMRDDSSTS